MDLRQRTIADLATMICGDVDYFPYQTRRDLYDVLADCALDPYVEDVETRHELVAGTLRNFLAHDSTSGGELSAGFQKIIQILMDLEDADVSDPGRTNALEYLNSKLHRENLFAYYDPKGRFKLRPSDEAFVVTPTDSAPRSWSPKEQAKVQALHNFLNEASEDEITRQVLIPLFNASGFRRVTNEGHRERILEYGIDLWMKIQLPTLHFLYFGIQVKKGKIDASGKSRQGNVADVYNQLLMILGREITDYEINRTVLVDHAILIAGGEITWAARNWLGEQLDSSKRRSIIFMERDDITEAMLSRQVDLPLDQNR